MSTIPVALLNSANPPIIPRQFDAGQPEVLRVYPFSANEISTKSNVPEEDSSVEDRLARLRNHYELHGMRRFCEAVMLCHEHNHLHVMVLQIANSFYKLPGGWLKEDEDEIEGMQRILAEMFEPDGSKNEKKWEIGETVGTWYRPNFDQSLYPYIPVHVTRPKEMKKQYLIRLPQPKVIAVPKNLKFLAIPFHDLYDNIQIYGPQLAALPHVFAHYRIEYMDENGNVAAVTPGGPQQPGARTS
ncbi:cleavage and polyadenylation specificity factor, 25 kDa subunit [Tothia fuscella]|uniref:Cleavage and polyadenylation specificity factor subunit 5 n=1 Tax=Tothia fuscella TaxID=1048955 RepID=A0A9P4P465_9PEZI|nr:cleavage and polyadenylation specificity factor, 25 kDa subunit [Tothia fuscella]